MKRIYIAGPIRAATELDRQLNIIAAEKVGAEVAKAGAAVFVPHSQARYYQGVRPDAWWIAQDLEWLKYAHALIVCDTGPQEWTDSAGTMEEVNVCLNNNIPIFVSSEFKDFLEWLHDER